MADDPAWLDAIEVTIVDAGKDKSPWDTPADSWCACYERDAQRMALVLRELSEKLEACMNITGVVPNLSDDAKALLKAKGKDDDRDNN